MSNRIAPESAGELQCVALRMQGATGATASLPGSADARLDHLIAGGANRGTPETFRPWGFKDESARPRIASAVTLSTQPAGTRGRAKPQVRYAPRRSAAPGGDRDAASSRP